MSRFPPLGAEILAVDLATILTFTLLHQFLIAVTWGPLMGLLFGLVPATFVVFAFRAWEGGRPVHGLWLGLGAGLAGALPWLFVYFLGWGATEDSAMPFGWYTLYADVSAALLAALAALLMTRQTTPAVASFFAVLIAFGLPSPFLASQPIGWVNVRALLALVVSYAVAGYAWERVHRRVASPVRAPPEVAA